jgi:molybdopterin-containing oxidoreductase family membrane subunit
VTATPVLLGHPTAAELSTQLLAPVYTPRRRLYRIGLAVTALGTLLLLALVSYTVTVGIGLWGNNIPVAWAFAIINFVWWIGIGHAGTLISAFLLLLEQRWRTSINRVAEAMTIFAVMQAGLFPLLHLGRPWFFYWLIPYPATMKVWPQWKSALPWDCAAVFTYFTVSLLFWYLGMIPDLAAIRDTAPGRGRRIIYGIMAMGWRGSARHQRHYRIAYGVLAGLATPLVISVHSIVSTDFAIALVPGWHATIFPPYFVAGAIFSGFAMVLTLLLPVRAIYRLENVITARHLNNLAKMMLATAWIVIYSYAIEFFIVWYSGDRYDFYTHFKALPFGPSATVFWIVVLCNVLLPQLLWSRRIRVKPLALWLLALGFNLGMWCERYMIVVQSLQRSFLPSSWRAYLPTWVDLGILTGTICFFLFLFLLFLRFFPFIPIAEMKELSHELTREAKR